MEIQGEINVEIIEKSDTAAAAENDAKDKVEYEVDDDGAASSEKNIDDDVVDEANKDEQSPKIEMKENPDVVDSIENDGAEGQNVDDASGIGYLAEEVNIEIIEKREADEADNKELEAADDEEIKAEKNKESVTGEDDENALEPETVPSENNNAAENDENTDGTICETEQTSFEPVKDDDVEPLRQNQDEVVLEPETSADQEDTGYKPEEPTSDIENEYVDEEQQPDEISEDTPASIQDESSTVEVEEEETSENLDNEPDIVESQPDKADTQSFEEPSAQDSSTEKEHYKISNGDSRSEDENVEPGYVKKMLSNMTNKSEDTTKDENKENAMNGNYKANVQSSISKFGAPAKKVSFL